MENIINSNGLNFKGSFIIKGKLTPQNKNFLETFKNYSFDGISNKSLISQKKYDVYVSNSTTPGKLLFYSKFNYLHEDPELNFNKTANKNAEIKEKSKLLLLIDPNQQIDKDSQMLFRKRLQNFEELKTYYFGFNCKLEYWKNILLNFFRK